MFHQNCLENWFKLALVSCKTLVLIISKCMQSFVQNGLHLVGFVIEIRSENLRAPYRLIIFKMLKKALRPHLGSRAGSRARRWAERWPEN